MLRWLFRLVVLLVLVLPLALVLLVWMAVDNTPLVASRAALTPAHIERAKLLLQRNDPRRMQPGVLRTIVVSESDLDLAGNYAASLYARGSARIVLRDGAATVRATFELPANPLGRYVNVDAALAETQALPRVEQLRIGRVPVPAFICNWLARQGLERFQGSARYSAAADVVKQVSARDGMLKVTFEWNDAAAGQIKSVLVPADEQARWQAYQARLVELTSGASRALTLDALLLPMLELAAQRAQSSSATVENRAALIVLAFYINGKGLAALVPSARSWASPPGRRITLAGRTDFPQHFTISAALAATAGSPLADAVGLYKEVDDARTGSGFSFSDIAADRAGTRFGAMATASETDAARLRGKLARGLTEADLVPDVRDLPEFLPEAEFKRRYGGIGQPAYQKMVAEIERRTAALPLYQ